MDGFLGYVWRTISQVLEEGETWVILSLVGTFIAPEKLLVVQIRDSQS